MKEHYVCFREPDVPEVKPNTVQTIPGILDTQPADIGHKVSVINEPLQVNVTDLQHAVPANTSPLDQNNAPNATLLPKNPPTTHEMSQKSSSVRSSTMIGSGIVQQSESPVASMSSSVGNPPPEITLAQHAESPLTSTSKSTAYPPPVSIIDKTIESPIASTSNAPCTPPVEQTTIPLYAETFARTQLLGDHPHQPQNVFFPQRNIKGKVYRFQASWYKRWPWLHYVEANDTALCHPCAWAEALNLPSKTKLKGEPTFLSVGFWNWHKATEINRGFNKHEKSDFHQNAVTIIHVSTTTKNVDELLSAKHKIEKTMNRKMLLMLISSTKYLARQGIPYRGHSDENSNFIQLLKLRSEDVPEIIKWLEKKSSKYTSPQIQNELIEIMALTLLRGVASNIRESEFFTIMADETTDASNREQLVICLRWIDSNLIPHEDFIGLYQIGKTNAQTITTVIKDSLIRLNLCINNCRGQCFDGCSTMAGHKTGVATSIKKDEPRALFTHCYGHSLNLACADTIKRSKLMKDALDTAYEITKLVKKSPKRDVKLEEIRKEMGDVASNIRILCPTRWTVRSGALQSILDNYECLLTLWQWALIEYKDTESKARVHGVNAQMTSFDFFFGVSLAVIILGHSDALSTSLQCKDLSACQGKRLARMTVKALSSIRSEDAWDLHWRKTLQASDKIPEIGDPILPRRRRAPARIEECLGGIAEPEYPATAKDRYRVYYYEALDLAIFAITERFEQPDYEMYSRCEELLLSTVSGKESQDHLDAVVDFFAGDFSSNVLKIHLQTLASNFEGECRSVSDIFSYAQGLHPGQRALMSEAMKLIKILLIAPATNATSERSFSTLRRIKTYLRTTMNQSRLNHLMLADIYKEDLDKLDLKVVANDFVRGRENRMSMFGLFE